MALPQRTNSSTAMVKTSPAAVPWGAMAPYVAVLSKIVTPGVEVVSVAVALATALLAARHGLVRVTVSATASPGSIAPLLLLAVSSMATSVPASTTSR